MFYGPWLGFRPYMAAGIGYPYYGGIGYPCWGGCYGYPFYC